MTPLVFRSILVTFFLVSVIACKEDTGIQVKSFKFTGNNAVTTGQLRSVLATTPSAWLPWGTKRYFSRDQFEADLKRIVAFYTDRGYPDARVTSFDAKLNQDQTSVDLTVNISEGEPVVVERVVFEGFEALPENHRRSLDTRLPLKMGQPLDRALLNASREAALDELRDHGHPYASVRLAENPGSGERQRTITFSADAGPIAHHGEIQISGNTTVSEKVIRRQLSFKPGDLFRQSELQESQRRLYRLELFEFANIEPIGVEARPETVPTRVTVTKSKHRKVTFGLGYGSEEKARVQIDWRHVNAFGGAQTVGVLARYSDLDRGVRLSYREPYIFSPHWSLGVNGQAWHTEEPAFTLDTTGGRVTITREFAPGGGFVLTRRPRMALSLTYANEHESSTISQEALDDPSFRDDLIALGLDPRTGETSGQRSALSVDAARNTTDNLLDAKRGYVASVHLEKAGGFLGGTYEYLRGDGRRPRLSKTRQLRGDCDSGARGHDRGVTGHPTCWCRFTNGTFSAARRPFADGDVSKWRRSTTRGFRSGARNSRTSPRSCARRSGGSSRASPSWMAAWSGPIAAARCRMTPVGGMTSAPGCVTRRRSDRSGSTSDISSIPFPA